MKNILPVTLAACLCISTMQSCSEKKNQTAAQIPEVNMVVAGLKTVPVFSEYVGETYGQEDVQIQSRVDGWVTGIHFKEGDLVQKGQLLYTIDDLPIRNRLDQAEAKLAEANTIKAKNKSELDRVEPLTQMHALSVRDLEAAKAAFQASVSQSEAAAAALRNAKIELDYARITAPISGVIGISKVMVGDYIGKLSTGAPLNTVSSIGNMRIRFSISEDEYLKFARAHKKTGNKLSLSQIPVTLILSDGSVYNEPGSIDLINRQIDPSTGSLLIQASFSNDARLLRPGQYVKIRLLAEEFKDAVLVPQQAVNQIQNLFQVFLLNDSNQVAPVVIQPGQRVGSNWIVKSGLKAGDRVAILGSAAVKPGVPVKPLAVQWNYDSTSNH